jgi:Zn-dependent alcohol dehydrogenase
MKAAVLHEVNKPLVIEDVSLPNPGPREVLIRTAVAGLCHSDLHFMEGLYPHPLPAVLGHESAGIVEKVRATMWSRASRCFAERATTARPGARCCAPTRR